MLYDLNNDNAFDEEIAKAIKSIFPSDEYIQDYSFDTGVICKQDIIVGKGAKSTIDTFMQTEGNDLLVLTSMDAEERDNWAKYIFLLQIITEFLKFKDFVIQIELAAGWDSAG